MKGGMDMKFFRNNAYWILSIVIGLGISMIILTHRGQQSAETENIAQVGEAHISDTGKPPPPGASPGGHWYNGEWHDSEHPSVIGKNVLGSLPRTKLKKGNSRSGVVAKQRNVVGITWKGGASSGEYSCVQDPGFSPLPQEIKNALLLLKVEKESIASLHRRLERGEPLDEAIESVRRFAYGDFDPAVLIDKGKPRPLMSEEEFKKREFEFLVGDRDLESATRFLADHGYYSETLLERLDAKSTFEYLASIETLNTVGRARAYAERVVAAAPSDLEARLYLADSAPKHSRVEVETALEQYQEILLDHPDSAHALVEAGSLFVAVGSPFAALSHLDKGHQLGAVRGHFEAAYAYQQLGDYKTAWVHLKKAMRLPHGERTYTHLRAIEAGNPIIAPLPVDQLDFPEQGELFEPPGVEQGTPLVPDPSVKTPLFWDKPKTTGEAVPSSLPDDRAMRARAAAEAAKKARADFMEMQELSQKELNDFLQWAETIMNADAPMDTNNFLMKEMEAHLKGGQAKFSPERIIRGFEIMERLGAKKGIAYLQEKDPEVATEIQRLLDEK